MYYLDPTSESALYRFELSQRERQLELLRQLPSSTSGAPSPVSRILAFVSDTSHRLIGWNTADKAEPVAVAPRVQSTISDCDDLAA
jgi:hypothetical protein